MVGNLKPKDPPRDCGECIKLHGEAACNGEKKCRYGYKQIIIANTMLGDKCD